MRVPKRNEVKRRRGSKSSLVEEFLKVHVAVACGSPKTFAADATLALGIPVSRQLVWKVLRSMNFTPHVRSPVPGLALRSERISHARELNRYWTRADQMLFFDEKKFRANHLMTRLGKKGYCLKGTRPSRKLYLPTQNSLPAKCEIVGAYGVVPPRPLFGDPQRNGDLGLVAFSLVEGKLVFQEIIDFIEFSLCPLLTPWPGRYSIVQMDNMPQHVAFKAHIRRVIERRGALCIFQPPNSPDLNMIEHMWQTIQTRSSANILALYEKSWRLGTPLYNIANLYEDCAEARETRHAYTALFSVEL